VFVAEADYDALRKDNERLRGLLRDCRAGMRDVLWCALVWNDHNFDYQDLLNHLEKAREAMGFDRMAGVDKANEFMARIEAALAGEKP
jgi:hypothetical protein